MTSTRLLSSCRTNQWINAFSRLQTWLPRALLRPRCPIAPGMWTCPCPGGVVRSLLRSDVEKELTETRLRRRHQEETNTYKKRFFSYKGSPSITGQQQQLPFSPDLPLPSAFNSMTGDSTGDAAKQNPSDNDFRRLTDRGRFPFGLQKPPPPWALRWWVDGPNHQT